MSGKLTAKAGARAQIAAILLRAAELVGEMPGCRQYAVCEDLDDETAVWVMEIWDDKDAHDASLQDPRVRALIAEARPLIAGMSGGGQFRVVGGHGL